jgi:hypothetical protein
MGGIEREDGVGRRRAYAPRRLTSGDRHSPRAYRRLLTVFQSLGIEDDLDAQQELVREAYEYWVGKAVRSHKRLIEYLKEHPEVLSHPEVKRLQSRDGLVVGEQGGEPLRSRDGLIDQR